MIVEIECSDCECGTVLRTEGSNDTGELNSTVTCECGATYAATITKIV